MDIIERKKEIDNSQKKREKIETRRSKNLILNIIHRKVNVCECCACMWACVWLCGFFSTVHFQFEFLFLFFGRFLSEEAEQKCYIYIFIQYIFSVVVSDLGSHTRMQSRFCIIFIANGVYILCEHPHSWGNVQ